MAKLLAETFEGVLNRDISGIVHMRQGVISFGETAQAAYEGLVDLVSRAEYLVSHDAWQMPVPHLAPSTSPRRHELAALRQSISAVAGFPVLMTTHTDAQCLSFARQEDLTATAQRGPATPEHAIITQVFPDAG